jgi:hypothetical protein
MAAYAECNDMIELHRAPYDWACNQMKTGVDTISAVSFAAQASEKIDFEVKADMLRSLVRKGTSFSGQGHKCWIPEEEMELITSAIVDWLSISQINGETENKNTAIQAVLHDFLKRK